MDRNHRQRAERSMSNFIRQLTGLRSPSWRSVVSVRAMAAATTLPAAARSLHQSSTGHLISFTMMAGDKIAIAPLSWKSG
jgi:hypothetical protein